MAKVSVIVPSRNEIFFEKTLRDLLAKATGDVEVIGVLDGYTPDPHFSIQDPRVVLFHVSEAKGMRNAINVGASIARGDYLMKLDGHCMMKEGYDEVLQSDCEDNWIVIPRRYSLDAENWTIKDTGKSPVDYHYLCWPWNKPQEPGMHGEVWRQRARDKKDIMIDDEMSSQGSCWFMAKKHFNDFLGGMPEEGYGNFVQEAQQLMNKTWLGGGRCVINKNTWYAHLHKGKQYGRGYFISKRKMVEGQNWSFNFWMRNKWEKRIHDIDWLVDKFWPIPTWPTNWKELANDYLVHKS